MKNKRLSLYINEPLFRKLLKQKGIPAIRMARDLGWSHTKLNWFVKGYYSPSSHDRHKIAEYLNANEISDLFVPGKLNSHLKLPAEGNQ